MKKTYRELSGEIRKLQLELEEAFYESEGEITDKCKNLMEQIDKLECEIEGKLDAYSYVSDTLETRKAGAQGVVDHYKHLVKRAQGRVKQIDRELESLHDRALYMFESLSTEEKVRTKKSTYYVQEYESVDLSGVPDEIREKLVKAGYGQIIYKVGVTNLKNAVDDGVVRFSETGAAEIVNRKLRGL